MADFFPVTHPIKSPDEKIFLNFRKLMEIVQFSDFRQGICLNVLKDPGRWRQKLKRIRENKNEKAGEEIFYLTFSRGTVSVQSSYS